MVSPTKVYFIRNVLVIIAFSGSCIHPAIDAVNGKQVISKSDDHPKLRATGWRNEAEVVPVQINRSLSSNSKNRPEIKTEGNDEHHDVHDTNRDKQPQGQIISEKTQDAELNMNSYKNKDNKNYDKDYDYFKHFIDLYSDVKGFRRIRFSKFQNGDQVGMRNESKNVGEISRLNNIIGFRVVRREESKINNNRSIYDETDMDAYYKQYLKDKRKYDKNNNDNSNDDNNNDNDNNDSDNKYDDNNNNNNNKQNRDWFQMLNYNENKKEKDNMQNYYKDLLSNINRGRNYYNDKGNNKNNKDMQKSHKIGRTKTVGWIDLENKQRRYKTSNDVDINKIANAKNMNDIFNKYYKSRNGHRYDSDDKVKDVESKKDNIINNNIEQNINDDNDNYSDNDNKDYDNDNNGIRYNNDIIVKDNDDKSYNINNDNNNDNGRRNQNENENNSETVINTNSKINSGNDNNNDKDNDKLYDYSDNDHDKSYNKLFNDYREGNSLSNDIKHNDKNSNSGTNATLFSTSISNNDTSSGIENHIMDSGTDTFILNNTRAWHKDLHGRKDLVVAGCVLVSIGILVLGGTFVSRLLQLRKRNIRRKYRNLGSEEERFRLKESNYSLFAESSDDNYGNESDGV